MLKNQFLLHLALLIVLKILCCNIPNTNCQDISWPDTMSFRPMFRMLRMLAMDVMGHSASSTANLRRATRMNKLQKKIPDSVPFPCNVKGMRSKRIPTSVHKLRPGDIDVIGAMGDSLTAGNGAAATNLLHIYSENRGISWSIGGQSNWREFLTIPNILKEFNPNLIGYSYGDGISVSKSSQFNVAEAGGMSQDLPYMAKELHRRIRNDPRVNFTRDWKMINVMIGGNDFCLNICEHTSMDQYIRKHQSDLLKTFRYIRDNIPRTFVNLIILPDMSVLTSLTSRGQCTLTRITECPCLFGMRRQKSKEKYLRMVTKWQQIDEDIARMPEFINSDTFTIVAQLFTKRPKFPMTANNESDHSYLSTDCFHFSQKGFALAASGLWNNLMEPVGNKSWSWPSEIMGNFRCPTEEQPYLYTSKNSNRVKR